jgi:hypothetical protein
MVLPRSGFSELSGNVTSDREISQGAYLGALEVTQDLTRLRQLEGERRLLEWPGDSA